MTLSRVRESHETHAAPQSVAWRTFLRGLAVELDVQAGSETSKAILCGIGQQMAGLLTLVAVDSLEALELEMNVVLAEIGWGRVQLTLLEVERYMMIIHTGLPSIGSAGDPPGTWLAPVLEGLYQGWMGQQPGANDSFRPRIKEFDDGKVILHYGR